MRNVVPCYNVIMRSINIGEFVFLRNTGRYNIGSGLHWQQAISDHMLTSRMQRTYPSENSLKRGGGGGVVKLPLSLLWVGSIFHDNNSPCIMDRVISDVDCAGIIWHEWWDLPFIEIFNVISVPIVVTRANCTILGTLHEYFIHMLINHGSWFLTAGVGNGKTLSNPTLDMIQKLEFQGCNCVYYGILYICYRVNAYRFN